MQHAESVFGVLDRGLTGSGVAIPDWASPSPCACVAYEVSLLQSSAPALNDLRLGETAIGHAGNVRAAGGGLFISRPVAS